MASTLLSGAAYGQDLPTGGTVVSGSATITSNGNAMSVNQSSDRMIANWQGFSIGAGNSVTFNQPDASSVALNRVIGQNPSQILGSLNANGQVFLINPNGVVFGQNASVQTGAFVASTLGISDSDFLDGAYNFTGTGGSILNQGSLSGRTVALISPSVINTGSITGNTALAAGTDVLLDFDGDGLLSVTVNASTVAGLVENKGLIRADGGTAILTAKGASDAMKGVVSNTGIIEARTLARKNGRILLLGDMQHGEARAAGTLRAKSVETSAAKVTIDKGLVVDTEGGNWLIDPTNITIDASAAAAYQTALGAGNVTISTASAGTDAGNITVNSGITWSANTLTLRADNNVVINAALNASGTAGLTLQYQSAYTVNAPINLASTASFSTKFRTEFTINYTILTSLGAAGSTTGTDLQGINGNLNGAYVLGANIDASATSTWNANAGFAPIGNNSTRFTGRFDGLGHTITGLTINRPGTSFVGLFGFAYVASISNVGLVGGSVTGKDSVGALVGNLESSTIQSTYATSTVSGTSYVGGLVGTNNDRYFDHVIFDSYAAGNVSGDDFIGGLIGFSNAGVIKNVHATGNVSSANVTLTSDQHGGLIGAMFAGSLNNAYATGSVEGGGTVGGLVGQGFGTMSNVYATGAVTSSGDYVGGLVGDLRNGTLSQAYATGSVSADSYVGGLLGYSVNSTVSDVYSIGSVSGTEFVGGLVGINSANNVVSNAYATGPVTSSGNYVGGLVGQQIGTVSNSFYDRQTSGKSDTGKGTPKTTAEMKTRSTFTDAGWDFSNVWGISSSYNSGYPVLRAFGGTFTTALTITLGSTEKTYGNTNPALGGFTLSGCTGCVSMIDWGSGTTAATNAGTYAYSIGLLNLTFASGSASDYDIIFANSAGLTVNQRELNLSGSRSYDGGTSLGGSVFTLGNLYNNQTLTLSGAGSMADKNVGDGKSVSLGTLALGNGMGLASNYTLTGGTLLVDIGKAALTVTANDKTKTYDGQAFTGGNGVVYSGLVNGETSGVLGGTLIYGGTAQSALNAGNYTLAASGLTSSNYAISYVNGALTVSKAALTVSTSNVSKTYDGALAADGTTTITAGQFFGTDSMSGGNFAFADKNAGTGKTVTVSGVTINDGNNGGNYALTYADNTASTINQRVVSLAGSRTYDSTTALAASIFTLGNLVSGETLALSGTGTMADNNAGTDKSVSLGTLALGNGTGLASNYALAGGADTVDIDKAALTLSTSDVSKTYDGTLTATGTVIVTTGQFFGTDSTSDGSFAFADKNAGTGKTVTVSGVTINDGNNGGNYAVTYADNTTSTINRATITAVTGIAAANKTYDGTTAATLNSGSAAFTGMVSGDNLTVASATGNFFEANPGPGKTVFISNISLGGFDAGNYLLATDTATTKATINSAETTFLPTPFLSSPIDTLSASRGRCASIAELLCADADLLQIAPTLTSGIPSLSEEILTGSENGAVLPAL